MRFLVTGDSMIKHVGETLEERLKNRCNIDITSFPAIRIENLMKILPSLSLNSYDVVLIHVGTYNIEEDADAIVRKFVCLFDAISGLNPTIKVLISAVIPRGPNCFFDDEFGENDNSYLAKNRKIANINSELRSICCSRGYSFFMRNPEDWEGCLGMDGLHLNCRGNDELANELVNQLELILNM